MRDTITRKNARPITLMVVIMLVLSIVPTFALATPKTPLINIGPAIEEAVDGGYQVGDILTVPINIKDNSGFAAAALDVKFDPSILEYVNDSLSENTTVLGNNWLFMQNTSQLANGSLPVSLTNMQLILDGQNFTGNGMLFTVQFKVKENVNIGQTWMDVGVYLDHQSNISTWDGNAVETDFLRWVFKVVQPASTETTVIDVGDASVNPGQTFTVPVSAKNNVGFSSGGFEIVYDDDVFDLVKATPSSNLPQNTIFGPATNENNRFFLVGVENITADMELFDLEFKVADNAPEADYEINIQLYSNNTNDYTKSLINASNKTVIAEFDSGVINVDALSELNIPGDLNMPAYDEGTTWNRIYNGNPHAIYVSVAVSGGGNVAVYYNGSLDAPVNVGEYTVSITVTDVAGYLPITEPIALGTLKILKAQAPAIEWPTASAITYGQPLSATVLSGGSTDFGLFVWDSSVDLTQVPNAGTYELPVVFAPNENTMNNYEPITPLVKNVQVVVNKAAAPVINVWPTASAVVQGQTLASSALTPASNEFGSFAWTDNSIVPTFPQGAYEVTFTPNVETLQNYEAIAVTANNVDVKVIGLGDIDLDGFVSIFDVQRVLQHSLGLFNLTGNSLLAADIDGDGEVTAADVVGIARLSIGLPIN